MLDIGRLSELTQKITRALLENREQWAETVFEKLDGCWLVLYLCNSHKYTYNWGLKGGRK